ncbi:glucosamine--fructose-6-phosphate aminotransferase (isomerizing) [Desulfohalotomaculum tongense]|uniref:glutamine--fructose-6-phosphate transaminase (isomerizing) n=1 Tax=Desulforadius tongensis TaxID=1216062 RepID=UPI00195C666F|nr:glutamine--fructose-6-phosphate transaminase (isomerizing) [Desulforadius tongensis]MBM7853896.1 glucosamine--fructose-6-phosphate aminotransferase (isomerizing) [Desulforadius tongensis]
MCGIVGYVGSRAAVPVLIEGLSKLEYRGYDSAGIVVWEDNQLKLEKKLGRLSVLQEALQGTELNARCGIGHTRWATHGRPSDINAHPHTDCTGRFAVVHNGIIENYLELKEWLEAKGHRFKSETDTEVLPHLVEHYYRGDLKEALQKVVERLEGSYAIVVICRDEPGRLVAARQDSPLVVGLGEGENFLASDIPALLKHTRRTLIIDDGEIVDLTAENVAVSNGTGKPVKKEVFEVTWEESQAEKGGYAHFMLKEIYEQPRALRDTLSGRITPENHRVILKELNIDTHLVKKINRVFIVACGTAYHAGLVGKQVIESLVRVPVEADIASEFRYRGPLVGPDSLVVVVSQSGETADTLAALREAKRLGARVIAVTNVVGSSISREADDVIYTWAGPEIAVASTKAYTTQLICMYLLGLWLAQQRGTLPQNEIREILVELRELSAKAETILDNNSAIEEISRQYKDKENAFFIGRGLDYVVAEEGALKLKEISYIHAEAYPAGELKHGTLALIVKDVPVIALATQKALFEKMVSNIKEVNAREASIIALAMEGNTEIEKVADHTIYIPATHPMLAPVLTVIPLQLLAYHVSVARGCDVDKPRNLAKSVTVE